VIAFIAIKPPHGGFFVYKRDTHIVG